MKREFRLIEEYIVPKNKPKLKEEVRQRLQVVLDHVLELHDYCEIGVVSDRIVDIENDIADIIELLGSKSDD